MPVDVDVLTQDHRRTLFHCTVNSSGTRFCRQCEYIKSDGHRCRLHSCYEAHYCWIHLKKVQKVRIAPSRLPLVGLGLFARTNKALPPALLNKLKSRKATRQERAQYTVFNTGDVIGEYEGEKLTKRELASRYDYETETGEEIQQVAPYGAMNVKGDITDALCVRNFTAYSNDPFKSKEQQNAKIIGHRLRLVAIRPIYEGEEILIKYGRGYWHSGYPIAPLRQKVV